VRRIRRISKSGGMTQEDDGALLALSNLWATIVRVFDEVPAAERIIFMAPDMQMTPARDKIWGYVQTIEKAIGKDIPRWRAWAEAVSCILGGFRLSAEVEKHLTPEAVGDREPQHVERARSVRREWEQLEETERAAIAFVLEVEAAGKAGPRATLERSEKWRLLQACAAAGRLRRYQEPA